MAHHMYTSNGRLIIIFCLYIDLHFICDYGGQKEEESPAINRKRRGQQRSITPSESCANQLAFQTRYAIIRKCVPLLQSISCCVEFNIPDNVFVLKAALPYAMSFCHLGFQTLLQSSNDLFNVLWTQCLLDIA